MKEKIKKFLKLYDELTKTYSVRILTSAVTYSLILIIIPLIMLINVITKSLGLPIMVSNISNVELDGTISSIILIINLLWSTSTLVLTFNQTGDTIYHTVEKRSFIRNRITSFVYFLFIIIFIICSLLFIVIINYWIKVIDNQIIKYLLYFSEFLGKFVSVWLITGFIYKKIIPVKIRFRNTLVTSLIITLIWYILTTLCFPLLTYLLSYSYTQIYSSLASIFLVIYYLYIIANVFIMGIIFQYYLYLKKYKQENN